MSKASLSLLALAGVEPYKEKKGEEYMNVAFQKNPSSLA